LRTDGTNCDKETAYACTEAGGDSQLVHVNQLRAGIQKLDDFEVMVIPGGFSYGDDLASGKILALELLTFLRQQLEMFMSSGKIILGICNGFQVLVRTGLLPFGHLGQMQATLTNNVSGQFRCAWVEMAGQPSPCVFTQSLAGELITLPIAHGEGKVFASAEVLAELENQHLIPLRYVTNPNGSCNDIAGVCDPTGKVFGLMPHPERFVDWHQHPNWRRNRIPAQGLWLLQNGITYAAKNLC
jgi:phosphoribosylformylglycinamidine synthase